MSRHPERGTPGIHPGNLLFNVFINDIFLFIENDTLYNYADNNTVSFCNHDYDVLISTLESLQAIQWYKINPYTYIHIQNSDLSCETTVKLLGIDYRLSVKQ